MLKRVSKKCILYCYLLYIYNFLNIFKMGICISSSWYFYLVKKTLNLYHLFIIVLSRFIPPLRFITLTFSSLCIQKHFFTDLSSQCWLDTIDFRFCILCTDYPLNSPWTVHQVRDAKIKVIGGLKPESDEEFLEWNKLSALLKVSIEFYLTS